MKCRRRLATTSDDSRHEAISSLDSVINNLNLVVIASNSKDVLSHTCNKGIVLGDGQLLYCGDLESAIVFYESRDWPQFHKQFRVVPR